MMSESAAKRSNTKNGRVEANIVSSSFPPPPLPPSRQDEIVSSPILNNLPPLSSSSQNRSHQQRLHPRRLDDQRPFVPRCVRGTTRLSSLVTNDSTEFALLFGPFLQVGNEEEGRGWEARRVRRRDDAFELVKARPLTSKIDTSAGPPPTLSPPPSPPAAPLTPSFTKLACNCTTFLLR